MESVSQLSFKLIGSNNVFLQSVTVDPTLVVIDNKVILATTLIQPVLTLAIPTNLKLGELVIIEAKLTGEYSQFIKSAKINWSVTENGTPKQYWIQSRKVIFGAGVNPATLDVSANLTLNYQVDNQIVQKVVTASGIVKIGDDKIATGIEGLVMTWAKDATILAQDKTLVVAAARALSKSFKTLSAKIGQPGLTDIRSILVATKNANNAALVAAYVNPSKWDNWGKKLQEYLFEEYTAKHLSTTDEIKKVWWDIAAGLWNIKG